MQKRLVSTGAALLAALCLVLTLAGCGGEKPLLDQPVKTLSCVQSAAMPTLLPLGDGRVLAGWVDYDRAITSLAVVDVATDRTVTSRELEGCWELQEQQFSDGRAVLFNWEASTWQFVGADLTDSGTFSSDQIGGTFSRDGSLYYFVQDDVLCRADVATGQTERVALESDMRFLDVSGILPDSETLFLHCLLSPYSTESGTAILNVETGAYTMLQKDWYEPNCGAEGPEFLQFDNETMGYDVLYASEGRYYRADAALLHADEADILPVSGSAYLLGAAQDTTLYRLESGISACLLQAEQLGGTLRNAVWLPEQVLVGCVYGGGAFHLTAIDPAQLTFTQVSDGIAVDDPMAVDTALTEVYWNSLNGQPLPATLQEARDYADQLEERYGVTILLSAQGQEACEAVWDAVVTTTDQWPLEDEPYAIARTLEALDRALALYPEGFFRQMRNTMGEGGVRFIPVGHIENDVNAVGLTYETYGWQNIYIDVTLGTFESVICHEIWHATEGVISYRDWVSFDPGNWSVCNPDGFFYNEDVEDADPNPSRWTFNYEMDAQNVYFVDAYARTNAKEDRARIMEYVMANEDLAGALMQSPYITQKLEIMCQAIRNSFDTSAWGDLRWERLLP